MRLEINVPGSKSIANRALALNYLSGNKTKLLNLPDCDDVRIMQESLKKLKTTKTINTGSAGSTTRFITALATLQNRKLTISGDKRMQERPIHALVAALSALGANVSTKTGCPPITINPQIPTGGKITLPGDISSQYLSALLMIAPMLEKPTTINIKNKLYSTPYIDITIAVMKAFGLKVTNKRYKKFIIKPQKAKPPKTYTIEPDASSASYLGLYEKLNPETKITIPHLTKKSIQGDIAYIKLLKKFKAGTYDMNKVPDLVMTLAALASFSPGKTKITNVANLRIKECDRLSALEKELKKIGIRATTTKSSITIIGNPNLAPIKRTIETYDDHRIAMTFAIINTRLRHLTIKNPDCVTKSYTTFWNDLAKLEETNKNIVLTGLRGSGKSAIGKRLAKKLHRRFIDTDTELEKLCKLRTHQIVEKHGWKYFRKKEQEVIESLIPIRKAIIATGGGAILNSKNASLLKDTGTVIYLHRKPAIAFKYTSTRKHIPALTKHKSLITEFQKLYKQRHPIYKKTADHILNRSENLAIDTQKITRLLSD